jgi:cytochrome c-type biogenesis protein CcmE
VELTPRELPEQARASRRRRPFVVLAIVVLLAAGGAVLVRALGDAAVFFKNADEAVAERDELGDRRFRLQGTVVEGSVVPTDEGVTFTVAFNDVEVDVRHVGDPVQLFQEGIPVVLEGHWGPEVYESDWMAVKHSEVYEADNPDRLRDADEGGDAAPTPATSAAS